MGISGRQAWTVVVADDQASFRLVLSTLLGLDPQLELVGEAGDGREAIRAVRELRPDVVLLDVAMPVLDGLEALPEIRSSSPSTRVVMLSALASESVRSRALAAGASLFLEKGVGIEELAPRIKGLCALPAD